MLAETVPADPGNGIQDTPHAGYGLVLCARGEGAVPGDWRARCEHMQYAGGGRGTLETMCGHLQYAGSGGGVLGPGGREVQRGSHPRLEVELFTFFVVGAKDKDIFVDKSKIVGLGV